jgi:hypothetical protein
MKSRTILWLAALTIWALSIFPPLVMDPTSLSNYPDGRSPMDSRIDFSLATHRHKKTVTVEESSIYSTTTAVTSHNTTTTATSYSQQSSCPPIHQIPNAVFYPFQFFQQPKHAHFLKDFERNRDYYRDTSYMIIGDNYENIASSTGNISTGFSIYYHIHKVGGTTMSNSFDNHPNVDIYYFLRRRAMGGREKFLSVYRQLLERLTSNGGQQSSSSSSHPVLFTYIRDPVLRFLSCVGEMLGPQKYKLLQGCASLNTTMELLECVLTEIEYKAPNHRDYLNLHLVPQSYELLSGVMNKYDLPFTIVDLSHSHIETVVAACGGSLPKQRNKFRSKTGIPPKHFPHFRLELSVLTPELVARICKLYAADVELLRRVGTTRTLCDPAI